MTKCYDIECELDQFSDGELLEEIERRKKLRETVPQPVSFKDMDWGLVRSSCVEYIEALERNSGGLDNIKHFVFEKALETVYGRDVWEWVNKILR